MSRIVPEYDDPDLGLGDIVEFDSPKRDRRMQGEVVRVFPGVVYHAVVDSVLYEITYSDNLRLIKRKGD